jgi:hypothetical protein
MIARVGSVVDQKLGYTIVPVRLLKSIFARVTIRLMATTLTLQEDNNILASNTRGCAGELCGFRNLQESDAENKSQTYLPRLWHLKLPHCWDGEGQDNKVRHNIKGTNCNERALSVSASSFDRDVPR